MLSPKISDLTPLDCHFEGSFNPLMCSLITTDFNYNKSKNLK